MDSRLRIASVCGKRTKKEADELIEVVKSRLDPMHPLPTFSSDQLDQYRYLQVVKEKRKNKVISVTYAPVFGNIENDEISTSLVERGNLTIRMTNCRMARRTRDVSLASIMEGNLMKKGDDQK